MIFPVAFFGSSLTKAILGILYGASPFLQCSASSSAVAVMPCFRTMKAIGISPLTGSATPMTAASLTAPCAWMTSSISFG